VSLKKLGRYELVRVLGKGAMGIVYEGRDPNLDRRVAIKTVKVENLSEEAAAEYEARFRIEARSAARLQHPNIVSVYDSDRDGDIAFLVMEFIQGKDLKEHMDAGVRYSLPDTLRIMRDLLAALDYAHACGVVHRDIKPANLIVEPGGRVKLGDFGVARMQDSGEATRTQGGLIGTPKYMSPEQTQGLKVDGRSDLFSAGVVLYQLLTGRSPFDGNNLFTIVHQIVTVEPPASTTLNAELPAEMDAVITRALAKDRAQRFATAAEFAMALHEASGVSLEASVTLPSYRFGHTGASSLPAAPVAATPASDDLGITRMPGSPSPPTGAQPFARPMPEPAQKPAPARSMTGMVVGVVGAVVLLAVAAVLWFASRTDVPAQNPAAKEAVVSASVVAPPASVPAPEKVASDKPTVQETPVVPNAAAAATPPPLPLTGAQSLQDIFSLRDTARQVSVDLKKDALRIGKDALGFAVNADRAGYVYVALASSDNKTLQLLFPNDLDRNNRIAAGKPLPLPRANWRVVAGGPPGTNSLLVVVTDTPRDISTLAASRDGPFMVSLNDASGRAALGVFLSTTHTGAPCATPATSGVAGCRDPFGAAMFSVREIP
jgi:serine/threonine protein kinase